MSKSYGNSIMLGATAQETAKLIKKSPTDSERRITFDPIARPQVSALLTTAGLVTGRDPKEIAEEIGDSGAGALKAYVIESVNGFLERIVPAVRNSPRIWITCATCSPKATRRPTPSPTKPWSKSAKPWACATKAPETP